MRCIKSVKIILSIVFILSLISCNGVGNQASSSNKVWTDATCSQLSAGYATQYTGTGIDGKFYQSIETCSKWLNNSDFVESSFTPNLNSNTIISNANESAKVVILGNLLSLNPLNGNQSIESVNVENGHFLFGGFLLILNPYIYIYQLLLH